MSKKDLKYYLNNPDEMPTDPKDLEALANEQVRIALEGGENSVDRFTTTDPVEKDDRTGASSDAEAKAAEEAKKEADAKAEADQKAKDEAEAAAKAAAEAEAAKAVEKAAEVKPEGVMAKDGKHVIPYAVLNTARERAEAAERLAQEQAAEIARLKAAAAKPQTQDDPNNQAQVLTDDELNALAEESPTLAKVLREQRDEIKELKETVTSLTGFANAQIDETESVARSAVQEAIDNNPKLAAWQADKDQTMYDEATRIDKALRESPLWRDKTFDERFAKVVELTEASMGIQPAPVVAADTAKPVLDQEAIRAAADAALKAKQKSSLPTSLSQIPGGASPAVDEKERVEQMSSVELGNKFLGMSKDALDAYLASL